MGLGIGNGMGWAVSSGGDGPESFYLMTEDSQPIMTEAGSFIVAETTNQ